MTKTWSIIRANLIVVGALVAIAASWTLAYAAAYFIVFHDATMWSQVTAGRVTLPAIQAWSYWGDARLDRLVKIAGFGALIGATLYGGLVYLLWTAPFSVRPPPDGSRIATRKDLRDAGMLDGEPGKHILLGTYKGREVRYKGDSHFFVNGPSRAGKGRGFVMTNLLEWRGSAIVLDVKQENFHLTGASRLALGQEVFLFAPGSEKSHRWNPLDFVRAWPSRATDLESLAASLIVIGEREEPYWKETARGLFAGILGYVLESPTMEGRRHLRSALRLFSTGQNFSGVLGKIIANEPYLNPFILDSFRQHLGRDEEQRPSFEGHVTTALRAWNNTLVAASTSGSDFDIRALRSKPFTLFIAAPVSDFGSVEPIIRLLIQQIHDVMLRSLPNKDTEPHRCLLMLDEFYQFERLPEVIKRAPLVAGYGLTIALVAQNIPQIDERYGVKTRDALLGNMDIQLYIGIGDETTAKLVSENIGSHYVEREGWSRQKGITLGKAANSGRYELAPIMTPAAVRRIDAETSILQIRGSYAALLQKLNFYVDRTFVNKRRQVDSLRLSLPTPEIEAVKDWPLFEMPPAPEIPTAAHLDIVDDATLGRAALTPELKAAALAVYARPDRIWKEIALALAAPEDEPVTALLVGLRERPAQYGAIVVESERQGEHAAGIWRLRDAVIAARRVVHAERSKRLFALEATTAAREAGNPQMRVRTVEDIAPSSATIEPSDADDDMSPEIRALAESAFEVDALEVMTVTPDQMVAPVDNGPSGTAEIIGRLRGALVRCSSDSFSIRDVDHAA